MGRNSAGVGFLRQSFEKTADFKIKTPRLDQPRFSVYLNFFLFLFVKSNLGKHPPFSIGESFYFLLFFFNSQLIRPPLMLSFTFLLEILKFLPDIEYFL